MDAPQLHCAQGREFYVLFQLNVKPGYKPGYKPERDRRVLYGLHATYGTDEWCR